MAARRTLAQDDDDSGDESRWWPDVNAAAAAAAPPGGSDDAPPPPPASASDDGGGATAPASDNERPPSRRQRRNRRRRREPSPDVAPHPYGSWTSLDEAIDDGAFGENEPSTTPDTARALATLYASAETELSSLRVAGGDEARSRRIDALRMGVERFLAVRAAELRAMPLTGTYARYSLTSAGFAACAMLRALAGALRPRAPPAPWSAAEVEELSRADCILVDLRSTPPHAMPQSTLYDSLYAVAARWNDLVWSDAVDRLVCELHARAAELVVSRQPAAVMDGVPAHRGAHDPTDGTWGSTSEFLGDVAAMLARMQASLALRRTLSTMVVEDVRQTDGGVVVAATDNDAPSTRVVFGVDLDAATRGLRAWLADEGKTVQEARMKEALRQCLQRACLRPGDVERHARANGGVATADAAAVLEHVRAPQQSLWWTARLGRDGAVALMRRPMEPSIAHWTALKVFDGYCRSAMQFEWWPCDVLLDVDAHRLGAQLAARDAPLVTQCMGEFNVRYAATTTALGGGARQPARLYRTVDAVRAVACWSIIMVRRERCEIRLGTTDARALPQLASLLDAWVARGAVDRARAPAVVVQPVRAAAQQPVRQAPASAATARAVEAPP